MSETPAATDQEESEGSTGRGALGFAAVLVVVLLLLLVGHRVELTQTFGVAGEPGTFTAESCGRDLQYDGTTSRAQCVGLFEPDGGGESFAAELYHDGDAGETYEVRADPDSGTAHRTGFWARWAAIGLPLAPLPFLWLTLGWWWAMRRPGVLTPAQRAFFVGVFGVPAALLLVVSAVGFGVALLTS